MTCIQELVDPWWTKAPASHLQPGRLVWAFVPFPGVETWGVSITGRAASRSHKEAVFRVEPLHEARPPSQTSNLPVAAMPTNPGEGWIAQRGKPRPAVVLSTGGQDVDLKGLPSYQRRSCVIVAPYYSTTADGTRGGFPEELVERIKAIEYPQFMLDELPIAGGGQSILRLDHVLATGSNHNNFGLTEWALSEEAMEIVYDWFQWLVEGTIPVGGILEMAVADIRRMGEIT